MEIGKLAVSSAIFIINFNIMFRIKAMGIAREFKIKDTKNIINPIITTAPKIGPANTLEK